MGYGFAGQIGIVRESTFGTAPARNRFIEALSESITTTIDRFETRNVTGAYYEPNDAAGTLKAEGDIVFAANPEGVGVALCGVLGISSTTVVASGIYTHEFFQNTTDASSHAPVPSYSVEVFRDITSANLYMGGIFTKVSLNCQNNQDLRVTGSMKFQTTSLCAKSVATFPGSPVDPFTFDTCSIGIGGTASTIVEAFTLDLDNQAEAFSALNSTSRIVRYRRKGPLMVRLKATVAFEGKSEYEDFLNQTERRWTFNFTKAASFALALDIPNVVLTGYPINIGGRERITVSLEGKARYNVASAYVFKATLTNILSGYAA